MIIVAIDETNFSRSLDILDNLDSQKCMVKIGSVSFNLFGHKIISIAAEKGFEIFVYGESGFKTAKKSVKRQALEVSRSIALNHKLDMQNTFFLQQNHQAVEEGSFHNDIVSLSNENVFIAHEKAFQNKEKICRSSR